MPRIVCVAGARPNYMKIKPVMDALERRGAEVLLVHTGQHYDPAMNDVFFADLGIRPPDRFLGVGSGTHAEQTGRVMTAFEPLLEEVCPDIVVVVGDINSTLACALVTAKAGPLLAHVEAGLRSRDWSMPEEVNRVATDRVADHLLAPSPDAVENLRAEGYREDQIHLVGNVMIDTLLANLERARASDVLARHGLTRGEFGLVTLHRPANVDDPAVLTGLLKALGEIAGRCPLLLPVHPRAAGRLAEIGVPGGIRLVPPAGYLDFIALQDAARVVLTDSGGVQEETTALGVPCVTLRDNTERPITVEQGTNVLAGRDPARIVATVNRVLDDPPAPRRPELWDGRASDRIADVLLDGGTASTRPRPTDLPRPKSADRPRPEDRTLPI
ncbi:UDP-N-acetylglucosamine 2-epimerase (non-hydrolyzing) [Streptomyces sp. NPDC094149]|uniref:non-hydrolyzing UDP-N-acetylglucosamine 2-epimerase n=1 Tax=Streptomyces sp. NPDC094149 TaxID=3155079 RepID=UPI003326BFC6